MSMGHFTGQGVGESVPRVPVPSAQWCTVLCTTTQYIQAGGEQPPDFDSRVPAVPAHPCFTSDALAESRPA